MRLLYIVIFALLTTGANAQNKEQTLADVRQDLTILYIEMLKLKREVSTSGVTSPQVVKSGSSFVRLEAIESELQRLIAQTEEFQYHVDRVVREGTNRIEILEFRLVELEGDDVPIISEASTLVAVINLDEPLKTVTNAVSPEPKLAV